jgi:hypothetical protein
VQCTINTTFSTTLADPAGEINDLGARIEVPITRAIVTAWVAAGRDVTGSIWTVELEAPLVAGDYLLVWRDGGPEPPQFEAFIPLVAVTAAAVVEVDFPVVDRDAVTPTVEMVAALERTRTTAGGGGDTFDQGETTFTEDTRPTAAEVEALIEQATPMVLLELPDKFLETHYEAVQHAIALYTALLIEGSYYRTQTAEGAVDLWRTLYTTSLANLQSAIDKDYAQWRLLGRHASLAGGVLA